MTRSFNHIGPRQTDAFAVPAFSKQIAEAEKGLRPPVIKVGNLTAKRDFTDVRDIVRAYVLLAEKGTPGETYNVGSGKAISLQEILDTLLSLTNMPIQVEQDPKRMRPSDVPVIEADISKLKSEVHWKRQFAIEDTLKDVLDYWREIT
jgi:GDP-4-dehydro-6-deoxy-D-mannose reductase